MIVIGEYSIFALNDPFSSLYIPQPSRVVWVFDIPLTFSLIVILDPSSSPNSINLAPVATRIAINKTSPPINPSGSPSPSPEPSDIVEPSIGVPTPIVNWGVTAPIILLDGMRSSHVLSSLTTVELAGLESMYAVTALPGMPVPSNNILYHPIQEMFGPGH